MTEKAGERQRRRALELGVRDFIAEPVDAAEVKLRVHNALLASLLEGELIAKNARLAEAMAGRSQELTRARREVLRHLATAAELRDDETGEHTERVGRTSAVIARACGLQPDVVELLAAAAPLHDVGKIGVPDRILLKQGPLTEHERLVMQTHAWIGARILAGSGCPSCGSRSRSRSTTMSAGTAAATRMGSAGFGSPSRRAWSRSRIFDALVFARPYKRAWSLDAAVSEIDAQGTRQFDPELVEVFMGLDHEYLRSPVLR